MTAPAPRDPELVGRLIGAVLLFGSVAALGAAVLLRRSLEPTGPELLSWGAVGLALAAPLAALALRSGAGGPRRGGDRGALSRRVAFLAVLEGGVLACAAALLVAPLQWPLFAALVPLALMVVDLALGG